MIENWPEGVWDVVLMDLPWDYFGDPTKMGAAGKEYHLLSDDDALDLPVLDLMHKHSILFLWATCPRLDFAFDCIQEWGLHFRGVPFVWVKTKLDGATPIGAQGVRPTIVKPTTEVVLAASVVKRGRPLPLSSEAVRQVVMAPKREHSQKPDGVQDRIEELYPTATKLEMFARQRRLGWDSWGREVPSA